MTVSFADPFDIPQFSKKYSVILKGRQCPRRCSATCKWLCIRHLTEIRVVVFTTLKMPKALIVSIIRAASWRELSDGIVTHETAKFLDGYLLSRFEQI